MVAAMVNHDILTPLTTTEIEELIQTLRHEPILILAKMPDADVGQLRADNNRLIAKLQSALETTHAG